MGSFSLTKEHRPCLCVLELSVKQRMHKEQSSYSDEMICHDFKQEDNRSKYTISLSSYSCLILVSCA